MVMVVNSNHSVLFTGSEADCQAFVKDGGHRVIHIAKDVIWIW